MSRANVIEYADMSRVTGVSERNVRMVPPGVGGKYQELSGVLAYIVYGHSADSRDSSYHLGSVSRVLKVLMFANSIFLTLFSSCVIDASISAKVSVA